MFTLEPASGAAGAALATVQVTIEDAYGNVETTDNTSLVGLTDTTGTLAGGSAVKTVEGVATFDDLVVTEAGLDQLTATDSNDVGVSPVNSTGFTISAASPSYMLFTREPAGGTAGAKLGEVDVTLYDQYNNLETEDNSSFVALTDVTGTLSGRGPAMTLGGVATFSNLVVTKAGLDELTAADNTDAGVSAANSTGFTVAPAPTYSRLAFILEPAGGPAGLTLATVTVAVEDPFGNVETADNSSSVGLTDLIGTLSGGSAVTTVAGVATFAGLAVTKAGPDQLTAADGNDVGVGPVDSTGFTILPAAPNYMVFSRQPAAGTVGATLGLVDVTLYDRFNNLETGDNTSLVSLADVTGTLSGGSAVATSAGVAAFSDLSITKAGTDHLLAADTADGLSQVSSAGFAVSPAAAYQLVFTTQPADGAADALLPTVKVTIEDRYGNVETSDTSTVNLSLVSGALGGTTAVAAVGGVAIFGKLSISEIGLYTLSAADAADGLSKFTSDSFAVSYGAPYQLVFTTQPANGVAGVLLSSVQVTIEDKYGNVETGDDSNVALSDGTGTLGVATVQAASNGVATFSDLSVTRAGSDHLYASDGADGLGGFASNSFTISACRYVVPGCGLTVTARSPALAVLSPMPSGNVKFQKFR